MKAQSQITQRVIKNDRPIYTLQYNLVDCKGCVIRDNVWCWQSTDLCMLLLMEKAIEQHGMDYIDSRWAHAKVRFKQTQEHFFMEHLERLMIETEVT